MKKWFLKILLYLINIILLILLLLFIHSGSGTGAVGPFYLILIFISGFMGSWTVLFLILDIIHRGQKTFKTYLKSFFYSFVGSLFFVLLLKIIIPEF